MRLLYTFNIVSLELTLSAQKTQIQKILDFCALYKYTYLTKTAVFSHTNQKK